jgi:hypothetical protein
VQYEEVYVPRAVTVQQQQQQPQHYGPPVPPQARASVPVVSYHSDVVNNFAINLEILRDYYFCYDDLLQVLFYTLLSLIILL